MAINKKLIHFETLTKFQSADGINTTSATQSADANQLVGNIPYHSIVFIKDVCKFWTHGKYYDCNNTWRGIQNNLTSTSTTDSLSAYQGKILNEKFANYLPLSGGTLTGALNVPSLTVTGASTFSQAINGSILGNAATASRLQNARTISLTGSVTGSGSFDGSGNLSIATTTNHNFDGRYLRWGGSAADVTAMGWGTLTTANGYTILSHAASSDGGDWGMVNKGGQIFMQLDGYYYQREGQYRVIDTSEITSYGSRNNGANKIVTTDSNGYIQAGWINTTSGATTSTIDRIYASNDGYIRYVTPATFRTQVIEPYYVNLTGTQTISGNKTFSSSVSIDDLTAGNLVVTGGASFAQTINGNINGNATSATYLSMIQNSTANYQDSATGSSMKVTAYALTGSALTGSTGDGYLLAFNYGGSYITQIAIDLDPTYRLQIRNWKNGTGWNSWKDIITGNNIGSQSVSYATSAGDSDTLDGYHAGVNNGNVGIFVPWPDFSTMKNEGLMPSEYGTQGYGHPDEVYLKSICKWAIAHYTNSGDVTLIGSIAPNSSGTCILHLYSSSGKDSTTLLPRYCSGTYTTLGGYIYNFGTVDYNWYYRQVSAGYASSAGSAGTATYASNVGAAGTAGTNYVTAANVISMYNWYNGITATDEASNTAIDKWNEIVSFLAGITDTSTLSGILANYLPLSGGTMTGSLTTPGLTVTGAATFSQAINGSILGNAATASRLQNTRTISLTGSVTGSGSFDGSGNLSITTTTNHNHAYFPYEYIWADNLTSAIDLNSITNSQKFTTVSWSYSGYNKVINNPWESSAGNVFHFGGQYPMQIASFYNTSTDIYIRTYYSGNGWKNWRKVAFSGESQPASDVYSWAKAENKPSYAFSEITGTVTNAQLAGSIANGKLSNSKVTIAGTDVSLGGSITADTLKTNLGLGSNAYSSTSYLPLAGGKMTGAAPITFTENKIALDFRPYVAETQTTYGAKIEYMTAGNEALVFGNKYKETSFIFKCGSDLTNRNDWNVLFSDDNKPSLQIKRQSVYINAFIASGTAPSYNLYVGGTTYSSSNIESGSDVIANGDMYCFCRR